MRIEVTTLRAGICAAAGDTLYVMVEVGCGEVAEGPRGQGNLALVIDRSGSMADGKLEAAKRSVAELVGRLGQGDAVGLVAYDDDIETALPLSRAEVARGLLPGALQRMEPGASTDLHGGWLAGATMLAPQAGGEAVCHVILLSDGQANHGLRHVGRICEEVANLCDAGITTTTIGFGRDFNEDLMSAMARAGNGRALYCERIEDLADAFDEEIALLGNLVWRDVTLQVDDGADVHELNGYRRHEGGWRLPALARGGSAWLMLAMPMAQALVLAQRGEALRLCASGVDAAGQRQTFELAWPLPPVVAREAWLALPEDERVRRRLQELEVAAVQREIRRLVRQRDWHGAQQLFEDLRARAESDPWLAESLPFLEQLLRERDGLRMSKELMMRSDSMSTRLRAAGEGLYASLSESTMPAYLRRKSSEGRSGRR